MTIEMSFFTLYPLELRPIEGTGKRYFTSFNKTPRGKLQGVKPKEIKERVL